MTNEEILASQVKLSAPLVAKDIERNRHTLTTVGQAAQFVQSNFSGIRSEDVDWKQAANSLEVAAATGNPDRVEDATKAVENLLKTENMLIDV